MKRSHLLALALSLASVHCGSEDDDSTQDDSQADDDAPSERDSGSKPSPRMDASVIRDAAVVVDAARTPDARVADAGSISKGGFVNLAIEAGPAFDMSKGDAHPSAGFTPPMGWNWYNLAGAKCRDGSQFGVFVHWGEDPEKLFIYFEGGGACANPGFCRLNPVNVSQQFLSSGESAAASLFILPVPQAPSGLGVFDLQNPENPFKGWSQVYVPYCTGDVYAGTRTGVSIEGVSGPQNFYGGGNVKQLIGRLAGTFKSKVKRFVAGGSSAGGYGAGINFGYLQDTFSDALGSVILDASPPFTNDYVPVCLQKRWRETWGIDAHYPSDCTSECKSADGGNLFGIVDYWRRKYDRGTVALISGIHDEIIRLFFSLGNDECKNYQGDPETLFIGTLGQTYAPDKFKDGLLQLRSKYVDTKRVSSYFMDGFPNATAHQCLFRARFYERAAGADKPTVAEFIKQFVAGDMSQVGP